MKEASKKQKRRKSKNTAERGPVDDFFIALRHSTRPCLLGQEVNYLVILLAGIVHKNIIKLGK